MDVIETDKADVQVNEAGATSYVNNYKIMDMLGEGTFSKVYLCQNDSGNEFALKFINKSILKRKREYKRVDGKLVLANAFQKVQKEVAIMKKLAHANLVRLYEVIDSPADDKLFLVLELIRGGQIMYWDDKKFRYLAHNTPTGVVSKDTARECLRDVVAALDFLHRNHICHRDIKPENILISGNQYKLADFGVAHMNEDEPSTRPGDLKLRSTEGTYHFLAPECTTGDEYDPYQVDVWALGVTMFTLLVGTLPFGSGVASLSDVMTSIREDPLILPPDLDPECAELLTQLMEKNPRLRLTVQQLKAHPWVSGSGDEIVERPLSMKVMVTQQEIEAAFTPVNNFILVMKLKMKMSSRLNNVRKSLASNACGCRRDDAVPVSKHVPVPSSELTDDQSDGQTESKSMEMAPGELFHVAPDRLQRRSGRIVESISETVGSLATSITHGKSQLGAISPVLEGTVSTTSTPVPRENSPSKTNANNSPGTLRRNMSKLNSHSVRSLFSDVPQRTDNARAAGITPNEGNGYDLSPGKSDADGVQLSSTQSDSLMFLNGDKPPTKSPTKSDIGSSPNIHRLTKRKSALFRGFMRTVTIPEGESASESTSPDRKKRRESQSYTESGSDLPVQHEESLSKTGESSSPLRRLSRKKLMSFRALIATPKSLTSPGGDVVRTESSPGYFDAEILVHGAIPAVESEGNTLQANGTPSVSLATTRRAVLSRRISLRNSRSTRALNTLTEAHQREKPTPPLVNEASVPETFSVTDENHIVNSTSSSGDCGNEMISVGTNESPGSANSPRPLASQLSRRNSTSLSFRPKLKRSATERGMHEANIASSGKFSPSGTDGNEATVNTREKSPSNSPPSLLSRRLSQRSPTSFRALPTAFDMPTDEAKVKNGECLPKDPETLPAKNEAVTVDAAVSKAITDTATSSVASVSTSPIGALKIKSNELNDELQPLQNAKLPVLDMNLAPIPSPVTTPATSPRRASSSDNEKTLGESMPRRRSSSPTQTRRVSLRVSPLPRNRSPLLKSDDFSSSLDEPDLPESSSSLMVSIPSASAPPTIVQSSPARRSTIAGMPTPPWSPKRLQRNQSINSDEIEDLNSALTRMTSLAKVLDACITTGDRHVEEPTSPTQASEADSETPVTLLTPTRRHQVQVPPLLRPESDHHQISPLSSIEKPPLIAKPHELVEGDKSPVLAKYQPRRKSLLQTQDPVRVLQGGKRSTRAVQEKRFVRDDMLATIKSKACNIM